MKPNDYQPAMRACRGSRCGGRRFPDYYVTDAGLCLDCDLAANPPPRHTFEPREPSELASFVRPTLRLMSEKRRIL